MWRMRCWKRLPETVGPRQTPTKGAGSRAPPPHYFRGLHLLGLRFPFAHAPIADGQPALQAMPTIAFSSYTTSYGSKQYLFEILAVWHGFQQNME
jgi:hypothetical protein